MINVVINVSDILTIEGACMNIDLCIPKETIDLYDKGINLSSPIKIKGTLTNNSMSELYFEGQAITTIQMPCDRCLTPTEENIVIPMEEIFTQKPIAEEGNKDEIYLIKEQTINLLTPVIDRVLLNIPMKILCKKECKGLCMHCGCNLNVKQCDCIEHEIDPRFEKLKSLFSEDKEV